MLHRRPDLRFPALDGLLALALPFLLLSTWHAVVRPAWLPPAVHDLLAGGSLAVHLALVVAGFLLCGPLVALLEDDPERTGTGTVGARPVGWARDGALAARIVRGVLLRVVPLTLLAWVVIHAVAPSDLVAIGNVGQTVWFAVLVILSLVLLTSLLPLRLGARSAPGPRGDRRPRLVRIPVHRAGQVVTGIGLACTGLGAALLLTGPAPAAFTVTAHAAGTSASTGTSAGTSAGTGTGAVAGAGNAQGGPGGEGFTGVLLTGGSLGQALLGIGAGLLAHRILAGGTGSLKAPLPGTRPVPRRGPELGIALSLAALVLCFHRYDLVVQARLLPVVLASAVLVHLAARPDLAARRGIGAAMTGPAVTRLGTRFLPVYVLHGPVLLVVDRLCVELGLDRGSAAVAAGALAVLVAVAAVATGAAGRRAYAQLARRSSRWPATPNLPTTVDLRDVPDTSPLGAPAGPDLREAHAPADLRRAYAGAVPRDLPVGADLRDTASPLTRAERISLIDPDTIPRELRLRPLPRRAP